MNINDRVKRVLTESAFDALPASLKTQALGELGSGRTSSKVSASAYVARTCSASSPNDVDAFLMFDAAYAAIEWELEPHIALRSVEPWKSSRAPGNRAMVFCSIPKKKGGHVMVGMYTSGGIVAFDEEAGEDANVTKSGGSTWSSKGVSTSKLSWGFSSVKSALKALGGGIKFPVQVTRLGSKIPAGLPKLTISGTRDSVR